MNIEMAESSPQDNNPVKVGSAIHNPTGMSFSTDGLVPADKNSLNQMNVLFGASSPSRGTITVSAEPSQTDTAVVIPIHKMERGGTMGVALHSLELQKKSQSFRVIIIWNGKSENERRELDALTQSFLKFGEISVVDAIPQNINEQSAGYARNVGLKVIEARSAENPHYRGGVFLLDSDTAVSPGRSVERLQETLTKEPLAIAVTARTIQVPKLTQSVYDRHFTVQFISGKNVETDQIIPMDTLVTPHGLVQIENIVGWGSQLAAKTCGAYLSRRIIETLTQNNIDLFVRMPYGSGEDMLASAILSRMGVILHNRSVTFLDQERETQQGTIKQRTRWGADHVHMYHHLRALGHTRKGLQIVEPIGSGWVDWTVPGSENVVDGVIINPNQLHMLSLLLNQPSDNSIVNEISQSVSFQISNEEIRRGLEILNQYLHIVYMSRQRNHLKIQSRRDLPSPRGALFSEKDVRYSKTALLSLLIGNIRGIHDIQKIHPQSLPKEILFGVRQ